MIDTRDFGYDSIYDNSSTLQALCSNNTGRLLALELCHDRKPILVEFDLKNQFDLKKIGDSKHGKLHKSVLDTSDRIKVSDEAPKLFSQNTVFEADLSVSQAQAITYNTSDGEIAHGFFYPPVNHLASQEQISGDTPPTLIVMVHGGPTARAYGHYDIQKQFWASNGFAIFDVNHRGSSGYGRAYRDALYGEWGEVDARDIVDGVEWLANQGFIDPNRVCIRGKSAGGYAVLRALTKYPSTFRCWRLLLRNRQSGNIGANHHISLKNTIPIDC